jgi:hypothetical protein
MAHSPAAVAERTRRVESLLEILRRHRERSERFYPPGSPEHRRRIEANEILRRHFENQLAQLKTGTIPPGEPIA